MKPLVHKKAKRVKDTRKLAQKLHLTKGDRVQIISGDDKGKQGTILKAHPKTGKVTVEGVSLVKKHKRATQTAEGGIFEMPAPIPASKAMLLDPKSGEPTRIRRRRDTDGTLERIAVKSGQSIPRSR